MILTAGPGIPQRAVTRGWAVSSVGSRCWGGPDDNTSAIEHITDYWVAVFGDVGA